MENKLTNVLYNAIQTPDGTILVSRHRHDFVSYKDKNNNYYAVDGGHDYTRRLFDISDYKELSVYDDGKHETRRKYLVWGNNYDENLTKLKETKWIPIEELTYSHIENILTGNYATGFIEQVLMDELNYRDGKNKNII